MLRIEGKVGIISYTEIGLKVSAIITIWGTLDAWLS